MKERQTDLVIEIAKRLIVEIQNIEPEFDRAFFRFFAQERMYDSSASYTALSKVFIVDAFTLNEFFDEMNSICLNLLAEMEKNPALLLLTIDKYFDYEIQFEYKNMKKWNISRANGGTGIPAP